MPDLLAIGTRKGLWLARSDDDRRTWSLDGPHLLAQEVAAVSIDARGPEPRVLAGIQYGHWGPTVMWSDDLGASWQETDHGAIRFPEDTGAALARVWQLRPDPGPPPARRVGGGGGGGGRGAGGGGGGVGAALAGARRGRRSPLRAGPGAVGPPAPTD